MVVDVCCDVYYVVVDARVALASERVIVCFRGLTKATFILRFLLCSE